MKAPGRIALFGLLLLGEAVAAPAPDRPRVGTARKDGLSLTLRLDKQLYRAADEVTLTFTLKNESGKVLFVGDGYLAPRYHEAGPDRHFEVHVTADGKRPLYFWSGLLTECETAGVRKVFRLKPGQTYEGSIRLSDGVGKEKDRAGRPHECRGGTFEDRETRRRHVLGKDGRRYSVRLLYRVRGGGTWEPPAGYKEALLWRGEIVSSPVAFKFADR
jgi:hypothetical protein